MEPELLTTKQVASVMNIGDERARAILLSRGIPPVSPPVGQGAQNLALVTARRYDGDRHITC